MSVIACMPTLSEHVLTGCQGVAIRGVVPNAPQTQAMRAVNVSGQHTRNLSYAANTHTGFCSEPIWNHLRIPYHWNKKARRTTGCARTKNSIDGLSRQDHVPACMLPGKSHAALKRKYGSWLYVSNVCGVAAPMRSTHLGMSGFGVGVAPSLTPRCRCRRSPLGRRRLVGEPCVTGADAESTMCTCNAKHECGVCVTQAETASSNSANKTKIGPACPTHIKCM